MDREKDLKGERLLRNAADGFEADMREHDLDDAFLLRSRQTWIHRQGHYFTGHSFGYWQIPFPVVEGSIRLLQMEWHGVMNSGANSRYFEPGLQVLTIADPDDIQVVDGPGPWGFVGKNDSLQA